MEGTQKQQHGMGGQAEVEQPARGAMLYRAGHEYLVEAYTPVLCSDDEKLTRLTGFRNFAKKGRLWLHDAERLVRAAPAAILAELEALLSGGALVATRSGHNLVVDVGLDDILDKYYKGVTYTATHYVLLTDGTPTVAAGDTMASHVGWAEVTAYSEAVRQTFTPGAVSAQSVGNSAAKAVFSINADSTTTGGFGLTTDNTKGGSVGTLVGAVAYTGADVVLSNGSTLNVTVTATAASS